jgi:tol-pal system protein YbgF
MKMSRNPLSIVLFTAWLGAFAWPAHAGMFDDDEARKWIKNLETRLDRDQADINRQLEAGRRAHIELSNQIEALKQEIAKLRGQIELMQNEQANQAKRQRDFYVDLDARIKKLEPPPEPTPGAQAAPPTPDETRVYEAGLGLIRASDYKGAIASLTNFLRQYPNSQLAPSAHYWIGNSHFALKDYRSAITAQEKVVNVWPTNQRAPDALLNIASNLQEMGDRKAACTTMENLMAKYPMTEAAESAKQRIVRLRAPGGRVC